MVVCTVGRHGRQRELHDQSNGGCRLGRLTRRKRGSQRRCGDSAGPPCRMWLRFKPFSNMSIYPGMREEVKATPSLHRPGFQDLGRPSSSQHSVWHVTCSKASFLPYPTFSVPFLSNRKSETKYIYLCVFHNIQKGTNKNVT